MDRTCGIEVVERGEAVLSVPSTWPTKCTAAPTTSSVTARGVRRSKEFDTALGKTLGLVRIGRAGEVGASGCKQPIPLPLNALAMPCDKDEGRMT